MNRRRVLALLGSATLGGCLGGPDSSDSATTTRTTTAIETTTGRATEDNEPKAQTTTPDPPELGVSNPGGCPTFDSDVKRVVCAPEVGDAPMAFDPAEQSGALPRTELSFTLTNGTDTAFTANFYAWKIWKRVDGEWFRVAPQTWPVPAVMMRPDASHTWRLTVDNTDLDRPIPHAEGTESVTVVGLGAGTYAFGTHGWFRGQSYENATGFAARFELTGEPLELTPTDNARTERSGDTVVVHGTTEANDDRATYVVTRVEDAPEEPQRLIPEQVVRVTPLRNTLTRFESGVQQVRLEAGTTTYPAFGVRGTRYVEYGEQTYEIETERSETETAGS